MNDDDASYLWDRSGKPDQDVVRLEQTLGRLRYDGEPPRIERRRRWRLPALVLAAAAAVVIAASLAQRSDRGTVWDVETLAGTAGETSLAVGEELVTDAATRMRVRVADIGSVELAPSSRLRLVASGPDQHRLALDRGRIDALVFAPPRLFVVETPAADAVDLGCAYTLEVDDEGAGRLHVTGGYVALEGGGREAIVPSGAVCRTRPGEGPGVPLRVDAEDALAEAVARFDADEPGALDAVLAQAGADDALTVWHLLARTGADDRARVFDRLAELAPPPEGVTPGGVARLDGWMLEAWWDALPAPD